MSRTDRTPSSTGRTQADARGASTVDEGTATATEASKATEKAKRAPRPKIDVGTITVGEAAEGVDFSTRATPMDSNPVAIAVKNAELGKAYPLHVDADKTKGVVSILRRAGARYGKRMRIASEPFPASTEREGAVVIHFKTEAKPAAE